MSTGALGWPARASIPLAATLAVALAACGSALDPDASYRAMQAAEARVAHGAAEAARCAPEDDCPAIGETCAGADDVCSLAGPLQEADADSRCEAARRTCSGVRR